MLSRVLSVFNSHWRGELPPAFSFFLVLLGLGYAYNFLAGAILEADCLQDHYLIQLLLFATFIFLSVPIGIWQCVGTWRSFRNFGSSRRLWKQSASIAGCCAVAFLVAWSLWEAAPRIQSLYAAVFDVIDAPSRYKISVGTGGEKGVVFSGEIAAGSAGALEEYLAARPQVLSLEINSPGGILQEASKIAKLVQGRRLATFVRSECLSACTLVYTAGHPRYALLGAKFGFHRAIAAPFTSPDQVEKSNHEYAAALRANGIDDRFVDQVMKIEPPEIWIPGNYDLKQGKVVDTFIR